MRGANIGVLKGYIIIIWGWELVMAGSYERHNIIPDGLALLGLRPTFK